MVSKTRLLWSQHTVVVKLFLFNIWEVWLRILSKQKTIFLSTKKLTVCDDFQFPASELGQQGMYHCSKHHQKPLSIVAHYLFLDFFGLWQLASSWRHLSLLEWTSGFMNIEMITFPHLFPFVSPWNSIEVGFLQSLRQNREAEWEMLFSVFCNHSKASVPLVLNCMHIITFLKFPHLQHHHVLGVASKPIWTILLGVVGIFLTFFKLKTASSYRWLYYSSSA